MAEKDVQGPPEVSIFEVLEQPSPDAPSFSPSAARLLGDGDGVVATGRRHIGVDSRGRPEAVADPVEHVAEARQDHPGVALARVHPTLDGLADLAQLALED